MSRSRGSNLRFLAELATTKYNSVDLVKEGDFWIKIAGENAQGSEVLKGDGKVVEKKELPRRARTTRHVKSRLIKSWLVPEERTKSLQQPLLKSRRL